MTKTSESMKKLLKDCKYTDDELIDMILKKDVIILNLERQLASMREYNRERIGGLI